MKIGIDLDDVLLDCNTSLALFHNSRYGTSYERKDVRSWHLEHIWGCTRQEAVARIREWYDSPEHAQSLPITGAREAIVSLSRLHELHIVTSRSEYIRELTLAWLDNHFPNQFSGIHFTNHFDPGAGSKSVVCKRLGVSFLVEDSPLHARDVTDNGVTVLLFDCPWNQETVSGDIIRVFTWEDVLDFVTFT